jgi:membrane-bound ClpP family serine protease
MELLTIVFLLLGAVVFMLGEIFFMPSGKLGFLSVSLALLSTVLAFLFYGTTAALWTFVGAAAFISSGIFFGLRTKTWERFSLNQTLSATVNEEKNLTIALLNVGEQGVATSALRPMGNASFAGQSYEVISQGQWIDAGTEVEIERIERNRIFVKPKS